jgi:SAM-dependent methyltransferase
MRKGSFSREKLVVHYRLVLRRLFKRIVCVSPPTIASVVPRRGRAWFRAALLQTPAARWDFVYEKKKKLLVWEIDRPQSAFVSLANNGDIRGAVLDVGCGTGDNALFFAERGHTVWGVDISPRAIATAQAKARARGLEDAKFRCTDAFDLAALGRSFDTVVDSGLFHLFVDPNRRVLYAKSLSSVVRPGGTVFVLGFSDREPIDWGGPRHRIAREDFSHAFSEGWKVKYVVPAKWETTVPHHSSRGGGEAWLARIDRAND